MEQITQNDTAVYTIKTSVEIAQQYVTFFPFSKKNVTFLSIVSYKGCDRKRTICYILINRLPPCHDVLLYDGKWVISVSLL